MALFSSINGVPLQAGTLTFPFYGAWFADVNVTSGNTVFSGAITLVLAGITLQGFVFRGGDFTGKSDYRLCGGAGWQREVHEFPYKNPFGLKLSYILSDVARTVEENVDLQTDSNVGPFFCRRRGPASYVLNQLAPNWWIKNDGRTQIGERAQTIIKSKFEILQKTNRGLGRIHVGTEKPEDWVPGRLFSSVTLPQQRISGVTHKWSSNKLETMVWTTP